MLNLLDTQMCAFGRCTVPSWQSCPWNRTCSLCLGHLWVLQTSYPHAFGRRFGRMLVSSRSTSSEQMTTLLVLSTWETTARTTTGWKPANLMDGVIRGWQPSSAARIGPFILCRSGWHLVCNLSAGYATFWTCEWRALRHIVSGRHAASMVGMENSFLKHHFLQPTGHRWHWFSTSMLVYRRVFQPSDSPALKMPISHAHPLKIGTGTRGSATPFHMGWLHFKA